MELQSANYQSNKGLVIFLVIIIVIIIAAVIGYLLYRRYEIDHEIAIPTNNDYPLIVIPPGPTPPKPPVPPIYGWRQRNNAQMLGPIMKQWENIPNQGACQTLCEHTPQCNVAQYNVSNALMGKGHCWLKNIPNPEKHIDQINGVNIVYRQQS